MLRIYSLNNVPVSDSSVESSHRAVRWIHGTYSP